MVTEPPNYARRVDLILQELDALPTLSAVAVRLLELTTDSDAEASEVIDLVSSDPSLSMKVLRLCRCHERGRASDVTTVERAVLLLGFEAVRSAVLAVEVFDVLDQMETPLGEQSNAQRVFDREAFWLHSLAVAVVAEKIAAIGALTQDVGRGEAFMAGLLHDIGQLVLHVLLPESFDRVCRVTETHSASLDRACKQLIGIDPHTTGRRLADHWGLPPALIDVAWLNGQPFEALPEVPHRNLIAVVTLADALVRSRYITCSGHWARAEDLDALALPIGLTPDQIESITADLHQDVSARADALGLNVVHDSSILLRAISRANASLARTNAGMRQREQLARHQSGILKAVERFHEVLAPASPAVDVLTAVAGSLIEAFEINVEAALFESSNASDQSGWQVIEFDGSARPTSIRSVELPPDAVSLDTIVSDLRPRTPVRAIMPWIARSLRENVDLDALEVFPLPCDAGGAILLLNIPEDFDGEIHEEFVSLVRCWTAALAAGQHQDAAATLTEQLAAANRNMAEMQQRLARNQTMATLGEVAAGAAHEMNNPLTVISGRAQMLGAKITDPELNTASREIFDQATRLSDMISALRSFAEPVTPERASIDLADLVVRVVQQASEHRKQQPRIHTKFTEALPRAMVDAGLMRDALIELVGNAIESKGSRHIEILVQIDPVDDRLKIEVRDDGGGLSEHALRHAFDPFYSEKPAGRQPGLGLARANRYVEAHGGTISLVNGPSGGAIATIWLSNWREPVIEAEAA